jgi:hypothetical protein
VPGRHVGHGLEEHPYGLRGGPSIGKSPKGMVECQQSIVTTTLRLYADR